MSDIVTFLVSFLRSHEAGHKAREFTPDGLPAYYAVFNS